MPHYATFPNAQIMIVEIVVVHSNRQFGIGPAAARLCYVVSSARDVKQGVHHSLEQLLPLVLI